MSLVNLQKGREWYSALSQSSFPVAASGTPWRIPSQRTDFGKFQLTASCPNSIVCFPWGPQDLLPSLCSPLSSLHFNKTAPLPTSEPSLVLFALPSHSPSPTTSPRTHRICLKSIHVLEEPAQTLVPPEASAVQGLFALPHSTLSITCTALVCLVIMVIKALHQELPEGRSLYKASFLSDLWHRSFSTFALLTFGAGSLFVVGGCPWYCRMFRSTLLLYPLDDYSTTITFPCSPKVWEPMPPDVVWYSLENKIIPHWEPVSCI